MKRLVPLILVSIVSLFAACKGKTGEDEASIQKRLNEKGTVDLMDQVSRAPDYQPPADGRLTGRQVEMYLDVRRRELKIREVALKSLTAKENAANADRRDAGFFAAMKAVGDIADVATADLRAAQELGFNPKEYSWIKERVLEAQMLQTAKALDRQLAEGRQATVEMLAEQRRTAADAARRAEIDRQIEELKRSGSAAAADSDPAKEHNAGLIGRYQDDFDAIQAEEQRVAAEVQEGSGSRSRQDGR